MKKLISIFLVATALWACDSNKAYDELPEPIVTFITKYWPNPVILSYTHPSANEYDVQIKNGPSFEFDGDYSWVEVDGEGLELPEIFLYDQLPSPLYEYLEGAEYLNQVFEVERDSHTYELTLLNTDITYVISTGKITEGR